jgi:DnaJ-related protein SCJ1
MLPLRLSSFAALLLCAVALLFSACAPQFALAAPPMASTNRDFYKILGLTKSATEAQIKKAYRKLSMKYHPDKNGGSKDAADKFQDVAAAYETLSNKDLRRVFDQGGEEGVKRHQQQQGGGGGGNPFDMFSHFFGGGARRGPGGHGERQRGPDMPVEVPVTLRDLYVGRSVELEVRAQALCTHCRGTGADDDEHIRECPRCRGQGFVMTVHQLAPGFVQQVQQKCPACDGAGKTIAVKCRKCAGKKVERGRKTVELWIEPGMKDGERIESDGTADEHPDKAAGNVVFRLRTLPHAVFTRVGDDLRAELRISLREALLGFRKALTHLDGRKVWVESHGVTQPGAIITLANEGMPRHQQGSQAGALHVTVSVDFPAQLTPEQRAGFDGAL